LRAGGKWYFTRVPLWRTMNRIRQGILVLRHMSTIKCHGKAIGVEGVNIFSLNNIFRRDLFICVMASNHNVVVGACLWGATCCSL
jgi:hypothetical protein